MRYANLLPLAAALAGAVVIPDDVTTQQLGREVEALAGKAGKAAKTTLSWWDTLRQDVQQQGADIHETVSDWWDSVEKNAHRFLDDHISAAADEAEDIFGMVQPNVDYAGKPNHHGSTNQTIYQAIQTSNYTKKFAALINDFPDIVKLLNNTETNVTAFIPIDKAFEKIPEHGHKPPKEFVQKIIEYHILPGYYPAGRVLASHTLPTALKGAALGGRPQRLRVSLGIFGLRVNFYSKVIFANLFAKNGIAHGVDSILVPPPPARRLISLFPSKFSTFELAAEKTGLLPHHDGKHHDGKEGGGDGDDDSHPHHHGHNLTGLTVFAPTNVAFRRLGPAANAFLFNTEKGLGFLRALLKYHVVANETLYSDAYYGRQAPGGDDEDEEGGSKKGGEGNGHTHVDLPTLLGDKRLSIDIARWYGFINIRINGYTNVAVEDGVARDGVVQVVNSVLIPPREHQRGGAWSEADGEIPVEELVERLGPYVEKEEKSERKNGAGAEQDQVWGEL
ncbi:FAS1 domain-containing protein [Xylaria palmicola]|nr:FAS1 domain-containing protein [Xylaria palmicola]